MEPRHEKEVTVSILHRDPVEIDAKFRELREVCDPRGFDLLDELRLAALAAALELRVDEQIFDLQERILGTGHLALVQADFPGFSVKV
jgi:hypothetical protein